MKAVISLMVAVLLVGCGLQSTATAAPDNQASAETAVDRLPLALGFFVDAGTPCAQASNATLRLHHGGGFGGARDNCDFNRIVKTGDQTYVATQTCTDILSGQSDASNVTFEVESPTAFRASDTTYDWQYAARHCPQPQLPEPWRSNDISDLK